MSRKLYTLIKNIRANISDFIRYTFTPSFGFVVCVASHGVNAIMAMLLFPYQPLTAVVIYSLSGLLLALAVIASFFTYVQYKKRGRSVFKKNNL